MSAIATIIGMWLTPDFNGLILGFAGAFLAFPLAKLLFKAKYYFRNFVLPEFDEQAEGRIDRWWSGFVLAVIASAQVVILFSFLFPLLLGLASVFLAEVFYLQNPALGLFPLHRPADSGQINFITGALTAAVGFVYWRRIMSDVPKTSWLYSLIMKIDLYALAALSGLSAVMAALSFLSANPFPAQCLVLSLAAAIPSAVAAGWRFLEPSPGEPPAYVPAQVDSPEASPPQDAPQYPFDWRFGFSRMKDTSQGDDWKNPPHPEEIATKRTFDPSFRFSDMKDRPPAEGGEGEESHG
jgi:hypothetical protein